MSETEYPYYRTDLARVHHLGFGFHADACARGVLALLPLSTNAMVSWSNSAAGAAT